MALSYWVSSLLLSLCHQAHIEPGSGAGTLRITPQGQCRRGKTDTFSCPRLSSAWPDLTVTHETQPVLWGPEEQPGHWDGALLRQVKGEAETKGLKTTQASQLLLARLGPEGTRLAPGSCPPPSGTQGELQGPGPPCGVRRGLCSGGVCSAVYSSASCAPNLYQGAVSQSTPQPPSCPSIRLGRPLVPCCGSAHEGPGEGQLHGASCGWSSRGDRPGGQTCRPHPWPRMGPVSPTPLPQPSVASPSPWP